MASAALLADTTYKEARPGRHVIDRVDAVDAPRFIGDTRPVKVIETGLTDDLRVKTSVPLNPQFVTVLNKLHELKGLDANWDGYGAVAIAPTVFKPVLELAIEAINRCTVPSFVALPEGGIGLRLAAERKELELDVFPNGRVDVLCDGEAFDNDIELEAVSVSEARNCLHLYCRA